MECLHQYFEHISLEELLKICAQHANIKSVNSLKQQPLSIITEILSKQYIVDRLVSRKFIYLEDLLEEKQLFITLCEKMTKKELQMTQRFLLTYFG